MKTFVIEPFHKVDVIFLGGYLLVILILIIVYMRIKISQKF